MPIFKSVLKMKMMHGKRSYRRAWGLHLQRLELDQKAEEERSSKTNHSRFRPDTSKQLVLSYNNTDIYIYLRYGRGKAPSCAHRLWAQHERAQSRGFSRVGRWGLSWWRWKQRVRKLWYLPLIWLLRNFLKTQKNRQKSKRCDVWCWRWRWRWRWWNNTQVVMVFIQEHLCFFSIMF